MILLRIFPLFLIVFISCQNVEHDSGESYLYFTGARIIDGNGNDPIEDGVLAISDGKIVVVGDSKSVDIPEGANIVDISGKTIMPGIINGHGHVGDTKGIDGGHYSAQNVADNLTMYARYGVTTVVSLGGDQYSAEPFRAVNDTLPAPGARLFIAGEIITGDTPEEALQVIDRNDQMGVDFMKIRVDDHLGNATKMREEVFNAIINRSHELGYLIATHMYYLEDARKLLEAGSDILAHSVRDLPVDDSFIDLMKLKEASYCPTLTRELSTFVYGDTAFFFEDPFFMMGYGQNIIEPLLDPERQLKVRESKSAMTYENQLPVAMGNLKVLSDAGVPIVFGTDSGVPTRFMGYFEHLELEMMVDAGMTPMEVIVSATSNPAKYMGLPDIGGLEVGNWADFLVLDANPLDDIRNTREISSIFIGGVEIER